jgi:hypothetical protein
MKFNPPINQILKDEIEIDKKKHKLEKKKQRKKDEIKIEF